MKHNNATNITNSPKTHPEIPLEDYPAVILHEAVTLLNMIDDYTSRRAVVTGRKGNVLADFRQDALAVVTAAATESVSAHNGELNENDARNAATILEILGVKTL